MFLAFVHLLVGAYLIHSLPKTTSLEQPISGVVPALYVFGDSLLDSGNNNFLPTLAKANYFPYGVDFVDGITGRFTNGRTTSDFLAEYLGLPYPPPVLRLQTPNWYMGFNYASGSCGILDNTGSHLGTCLNLKNQIKLFKETIKSVLKRRYKNQRDLSFYLYKSIFIISIGSNDYLANYLDSTYPISKHYNPQQFSQLLIRRLSHHLKKLYKLGARKIILFELGPIGCIPWIRRTSKKCNNGVNEMVSLFNDELGLLLSNLTISLPESHIVLSRIYKHGYDVINHPKKYGLSSSRNPCCKAWFNDTLSCIRNLQPCINHEKYFFWDAFHLTEAVYNLTASHCISGSTICKPINIQQLVRV